MKSARSATPSTNRFVPFIATTALVIGTVVTATRGATADGGTAPPSSGGRVVAFGEHPDALRTGTFTAVAGGWAHNLALSDDGQVIAWGTRWNDAPFPQPD
ncbi:Regulator of chromosome condensation (RCC1) repeat-containing protein [Micrococcales bacterium KH10]|nr:Regulator of chromosome condensation (RCC1) repeat-containing protein [Micrococcales bacterium KH10]